MRRRNDPLPQTSAASLGAAHAAQHCPEIRPAPSARVMNAVAQRRKDGHRRLQEEAKGHRPAGPGQNVPPHSIQVFKGNAVPDGAENQQADDQRGCQTRSGDS
jgi:hypothetical protein